MSTSFFRERAASLRAQSKERDIRRRATVSSVSDRIAGSLGIKLAPAETPDQPAPDDAEFEPAFAALVAAMDIVAHANPAVVYPFDAEFDRASATLVENGWHPSEPFSPVAVALAAADRRIAVERSNLLASSFEIWGAAIKHLVPTFGNVSARVADENKTTHVAYFREDDSGATAMLLFKKVSGAITTMTLMIDFAKTDPAALRDGFLEAEFARSTARSTQDVDGDGVSISANIDRNGRDGNSVRLNAQVWSRQKRAWLEQLGYPDSTGTLEVHVEEAMY